MTQQQQDNPFAPQERLPSVSWATARPGHRNDLELEAEQ